MNTNTKLSKSATSEKVRGIEIFGHSVAGMGQNLVFGLWSSFILLFYTDIFGITAGVAGTIMMLARILDAVNDPITGMLTDRTRTKWGRFRPWFLFMAVPIAIFLAISFYTPNIGTTAKIVYAAVTYVLMSTAFDFVDVPFWTLPSVMTRDIQKRTSIYGIARIVTTVSGVVVSIIGIPLIMALSGDNSLNARGFFLTAIVLGSIAAVCYLVGFLLTREHVVPSASEEKVKISDSLRAVWQNKPLLLILLSMLLVLGTSALRSNLMPFFVRYNLGNIGLLVIFNILPLPGLLLGAFFASFISKKIGQKTLYIVACIGAGIINLILFFAGYSNVKLIMALMGIGGIFSGFIIVLISTLIANTIEYAEWKSGKRHEGIISSTQTFVSKLCIAVGGGLSGLILTVSHYVPNVEQTAQTTNAIYMGITLFVAISLFLGVIPMLFNDLTEKRHAEIVAEINARNNPETTEAQ